MGRPAYATVAHTTVRTAALYLRVSTPQQDEEDKTSLKTQEAEARAHAALHGFVVDEAHVYREKCTAEDYYERPVLLSLREAAARGAFDVVLVHAVDRLSRDPRHLITALTELERAGAEVQFVVGKLEDTPEGWLVAYVKGYAAQMENRMRVERFVRNKRAQVMAGRPLPSNRPLYGYQWVVDPKRITSKGVPLKERLTSDPVTAPIVQRIFAESLSGKTLRNIAAGLTEEGIPSPATYAGRRNGAKFWDPGVVRQILLHPTYWGEPHAYATKSVPLSPQERVRGGYKYRAKRVLTSADEQVALPADVAPALVSKEVAMQVHDRLETNRRLASRNYRRPEVTLLHGGMARCAYCGGAMTITNTSHYHTDGTWAAVYLCKKVLRSKGACRPVSIRCHLLDAAIWDKVRLLLLDPSLIAYELERSQENASASPARNALAAIETRIADLTRRIDNKRKFAEVCDDDDERADLAEEIKDLRLKRRELEAERDVAVVHVDKTETQARALANVMEWARELGPHVDNLSMMQRRAILIALGASVRVWQVKDRDPRIALDLDLPASGILPVITEPDGSTSVCVTTVTGKVQKFIMRQQAIEELRLQASATTVTA